MYNRSQTWAGGQSAGPGGMPRPGNSASKSGSEYEYSGYGSGGYDYEYNYAKDQGNGSSFVPRTPYGNDTSAPPQYPPSQAV